MHTIFMNSRNSKTSDPPRLLLNFSDKIKLKTSKKHVALSNLSICYAWKNIKKTSKIINLKYYLRHGMKSLNYLMNYILYPIFKNILSICQKTWIKD